MKTPANALHERSAETLPFNMTLGKAIRIDADLPMTSDLEKGEQYRADMIQKHGVTTRHCDVWREFHATDANYNGLDSILGRGADAVAAIDDYLEQLENEQ